LEADPGLFEDDEKTYKILKQNDKSRLEIMTDLLSSHLGIVVVHFDNKANDKNYVSAYFLGRHEVRFIQIYEHANILSFFSCSSFR
jgi:hypothetical protein